LRYRDRADLFAVEPVQVAAEVGCERRGDPGVDAAGREVYVRAIDYM